MSERYTRLFAMPENLYAEGSPVVLAAGALLKDNETGKVLVQLKIKNISGKTIKAAKVRVTLFDTVGKPLGEETDHQYLDLNIERDKEFGQKVAIELPDASTRSFSVEVIEVDFADNSIWVPSGAEWEPLPKQAALADWLNDAELEKQYRLEYGKDCRFAPLEVKDLWLCPCGEINRQGETSCHHCEKRLPDLKAADLEKLKADRDARLAEEKEKAEKEKATAEIRAKKNKKIAAIIVPVVAVLITASVLISNAVTKKNAYNDALALMEAGLYEEAVAAFTALDGYKDSNAQIRNAENELHYNDALSFLEAGKYKEAYAAFESLGDYKDTQKYIERFQSEYKLTVETSELNGEAFYKKEYEYANGLLVKETAIGNNSEIFIFHGYGLNEGDTCYAEYEYNANGNVAETRVYQGNGNQIHTCTYKYDSNGYLVKETNDSIYPNGTHSWFTYEYDDRGNRTQRLWYNIGEAGIYSSTYYEYDEHDQLICSGFEYEWGAKSDTSYNNQYDEKGRLIKQVSLSSPNGYSETVEYEYDDFDNVAVKRKMDNGWIREYSYEYDDKGNVLIETINSHSESETRKQITTYTYDQIFTYKETL